jgi:hypothetical protein
MKPCERLDFYPIIGGSENMSVCDIINLRCRLARKFNCGIPFSTCKEKLARMGYKFRGDTWVCVSCGVPFGSRNHALSCGIGGPGAK